MIKSAILSVLHQQSKKKGCKRKECVKVHFSLDKLDKLDAEVCNNHNTIIGNYDVTFRLYFMALPPHFIIKTSI